MWRRIRIGVLLLILFVVAGGTWSDPERTTAVPHSLGLQAGLLGVVYAFADETLDAPNNVVIAHEVLHTLGATDKYDPETAVEIQW